MPAPSAGRVAFITGASSGLGRRLAVRLSRDGIAVALAARRADRLDEVADAIRDEGGGPSPVRAT